MNYFYLGISLFYGVFLEAGNFSKMQNRADLGFPWGWGIETGGFLAGKEDFLERGFFLSRLMSGFTGVSKVACFPSFLDFFLLITCPILRGIRG
jgi:hypothetical protein